MYKLFSVSSLILPLLGQAFAQDQPSSWLDVNPSIYVPPSSVDPPYSTSSEAVTSTVQSRPVITTIAVPYSISTATADAGSLKKGDLFVEFSEDFRKHLVDTAKAACGSPKKRDVGPKKDDITTRAVAACENMGQFMADTVGDGAPGGLDIISFNRKIITANDIEAGVRKFFAAGRVLYASRLWIGGIAMVWLGLYLEGKNNDATHPIVVPQTDLGNPTGKVASSLPTSTSTGSGCKTTKTGSAAPICDDKEGCDGMAHKTCEVDKNEDHLCPCSTLLDYRAHPIDVALLTAQQQILQTIMNSPTPQAAPTPQCLYGANPVDEHGPIGVTRVPTESCACGSKTYSVAKSGDPCPYATTPGVEVTFTTSTASSATTSIAPSATTTQACAQGPFNPPDWILKRDDVVKASESYCDHLMQVQKDNGAKVANNWPGSCAWVFDNDVKKMTAAFQGENMCPDTTPVVDTASCKSSFLKAIDNCDPAQPPPNYKRSGTYGEKCMRWSWHAAPYLQAGSPCVGRYNGPDKPPITKRN